MKRIFVSLMALASILIACEYQDEQRMTVNPEMVSSCSEPSAMCANGVAYVCNGTAYAIVDVCSLKGLTCTLNSRVCGGTTGMEPGYACCVDPTDYPDEVL